MSYVYFIATFLLVRCCFVAFGGSGLLPGRQSQFNTLQKTYDTRGLNLFVFTVERVFPNAIEKEILGSPTW